MKVLVVGSGAREHALAWRISRSPRVKAIFAAPGNPGIAQVARCVDIMPDNIEGLADFAAVEGIGLTVVGPEAPLAKGIVNLFLSRGLRVFGPTQEAAELESSKAYCKGLLRREGIPTSNFRVFREPEPARAHAHASPLPLVVKADGLAAGKGTFICRTPKEAEEAIDEIMVRQAFGPAGRQIVIEEFLSGVEASIQALVDGRNLLILESAQDHKRLLDGDHGPNTGGMGAYSPATVVSEADLDRVVSEILVPAVHAMDREERPFQGVLYAGVMLTRSGPRLLEFNVRFGDPEAQALLARIQSDLVDLLDATLDGRLDRCEPKWDPRPSVCVVLTSRGYPGTYDKGHEISGIGAAAALPDVQVFHAGTSLAQGKLVTSGGRVLSVTALGDTVAEAQRRAYEAVQRISFPGVHFRTDIAHQALTPPPART